MALKKIAIFVKKGGRKNIVKQSFLKEGPDGLQLISKGENIPLVKILDNKSRSSRIFFQFLGTEKVPDLPYGWKAICFENPVQGKNSNYLHYIDGIRFFEDPKSILIEIEKFLDISLCWETFSNKLERIGITFDK